MLSGNTAAAPARSAIALGGNVQAVAVTLDGKWARGVADGLRQHNLPVLVSDNPKRWQRHFDPQSSYCIIVDLDHGADALAGTRQWIAGEAGRAGIIAAATSPSVTTVVAAMRAGAVDFICKQSAVGSAVDQIIAVAEQMVETGHRAAATAAVGSNLTGLTAREKTVLRALSQGMATKQIAHQLSLSPRTVEMFRSRIKQRLHVGSIAEAVGIWTSHGDVAAARGPIRRA